MASFAKAAPAGGYDIGPATVYSSHGHLKQPEIFALSCAKCKFILREPKQVIVCGHRYCKLCIEQLTNGRYSLSMCMPRASCCAVSKWALQQLFMVLHIHGMPGWSVGSASALYVACGGFDSLLRRLHVNVVVLHCCLNDECIHVGVHVGRGVLGGSSHPPHPQYFSMLPYHKHSTNLT